MELEPFSLVLSRSKEKEGELSVCWDLEIEENRFCSESFSLELVGCMDMEEDFSLESASLELKGSKEILEEDAVCESSFLLDAVCDELIRSKEMEWELGVCWDLNSELEINCRLESVSLEILRSKELEENNACSELIMELESNLKLDSLELNRSKDTAFDLGVCWDFSGKLEIDFRPESVPLELMISKEMDDTACWERRQELESRQTGSKEKE